MKIEIKTERAELSAFLKYFYYVEEIAQANGYNTGVQWTVKASAFHERLMKAVKPPEAKKKSLMDKSIREILCDVFAIGGASE